MRDTMEPAAGDGTGPGADVPLDNDDSDFSDYCEDRSQLVNQALRAKLLNGVLHPTTGLESKLRVSVFDHRIIPKKLIIADKNDNTSSIDIRDNLNDNKPKSHSGANANEQDNANKRKGHGMSYTVLKAQRKSSSTSDSKGDEAKMEPDNDYRTRFDILLRNLIGDVSGLQVEPSPMTVSSGYESDYIQTHEENIDKIFTEARGSQVDNKENIPSSQHQIETPAGYFSLSRTASDLTPCSPLAENHFTSLPSIPTQNSEKPKPRSFEEKEASSKCNKPEKDSNGFSYAQRHNYKLTKVTRSMYEIIHDLQNGEKPGTDGRKRSRKGRKLNQDGNSCSDGSNSARESKPCVRYPAETRQDNKAGPVGRAQDGSVSSFSGSVVRCVRRPLVSDGSLRPVHRKTSQSEASRLQSSGSANDCDKVQNDLRSLLCDTSDVTFSSADNAERVGGFNTVSSDWSRLAGGRGTTSGPPHSGGSQADGPITATNHRPRRPTLTEQFVNRPRPEDHVYETIPGDEKLYEEWKKMRENPKIPKIRRYTTVPDLPGTFIPKEPPALPARRYLNNNINNTNNQSYNSARKRESDDYIVMGDINSNFPPADSGPAPCDPCSPAAPGPGQLLEPARLFECYPYTLHDDTVFNEPARNDETSDGYCSIDNLSLLRETVTGLPEAPLPPPLVTSLPRAPLKRSDFFLPLNHGNPSGLNLSSSHLFLERSAGADRRGHRDRDPAGLTSCFMEESVKPVVQATYV